MGTSDYAALYAKAETAPRSCGTLGLRPGCAAAVSQGFRAALAGAR